MTSETASHTAGSDTPDNLARGLREAVSLGGMRTSVAMLMLAAAKEIERFHSVPAATAASPDLLKAAKRALATFRAQGVHRDGNNVVAALEDAIALATQSKGA